MIDFIREPRPGQTVRHKFDFMKEYYISEVDYINRRMKLIEKESPIDPFAIRVSLPREIEDDMGNYLLLRN
ncbi:MAG: hypothetical protein ABFD62_04605 [Syntrophaceae bacterium]